MVSMIEINVIVVSKQEGENAKSCTRVSFSGGPQTFHNYLLTFGYFTKLHQFLIVDIALVLDD